MRNRRTLDISGLNRDINNVQRVTGSTYFALQIPGLNLAKLQDDIKKAASFLTAATTEIPEHVRRRGEYATSFYQQGVLRGLTNEQLASFVSSEEFDKFVKAAESYDRARAAGDARLAAGILKLVREGVEVYFNEADKQYYAVNSNCTSGGKTACDILLDKNQLKGGYSREDIKKLVLESLATLTEVGANPRRLADQSIAALAIQCAVSYSIETGDGSLVNELRTALGGGEAFDRYLRYARLDPIEVGAVSRFSEIVGKARSGDTLAALAAARLLVDDANAGRIPGQYWYAAQQLIRDIEAGWIPSEEEMRRLARAIYATDPVNWGIVQSVTGSPGVLGTIDECGGDQRCKAYAQMINVSAKPGTTGGELALETARSLGLLAAEALVGETIGRVVAGAIVFITPKLAQWGGQIYEKIGGTWTRVDNAVLNLTEVQLARIAEVRQTLNVGGRRNIAYAEGSVGGREIG